MSEKEEFNAYSFVSIKRHAHEQFEYFYQWNCFFSFKHFRWDRAEKTRKEEKCIKFLQTGVICRDLICRLNHP